MHIPDGYLSPSTCAALYGAAVPFWYVAIRRVRQSLSARFVPLLSVFSAFAFVVMMFNLPLPGGTSGHAVGVGIASIVLGPSASMLAISVALAIQAVFFGDGGVTALGANCFNMAIMGSLVGWAVYRLIAGNSPVTSSWRVVSAALAGYAAINVSALLAAVELGLQALLFKDATGSPIYAPYQLGVAVPAMMIGHLTFAGIAELIVSGGVVAYLQKADPSLLKVTAPGGAVSEALGPSPALAQSREWGWRRVAPLWIGVAVLLILTPLGLLAAGTAWGEWSARDFWDPSARRQIAAASSGQSPPAGPPSGLERLSSVWTAPISHYAPPLMKSAAFGYMMSAMFGAGLILLTFLIIGRLALRAASAELEAAAPARSSPGEAVRWPLARKRRGGGFIEGSISSLLGALEHAFYAEEIARMPGLLQRLDARIKVAGLLALVVAAALSRKLSVILALLAAAVVIALVSRVPVRALVTRVWTGALLFTGLIALPAIFFVPGRPLFTLPLVGWTGTAQGLRSAIYLISRVEAAATFSMLLILCTPWARVLKALGTFKVPALLVVMLGMTYRYAFLVVQTACDMLESRRSRMIGVMAGRDRRRLAAASVGVLLGKTFNLSSQVYLAMQSRGFRGEVHTLDDFRVRARDWIALAGFMALAGLALWLGR